MNTPTDQPMTAEELRRRKNTESKRKYRAANREKCREYVRKYQAATREKCRERCRKYQAANNEKCREYWRKYYASHPEKVAVKVKNWRQKNPERTREIQRRSKKACRERKNHAALAAVATALSVEAARSPALPVSLPSPCLSSHA